MPNAPSPSRGRWTIEVISPDERGVNIYLTQYKPFRLLALQESPDSFSSTYERETAFTNKEWIQRLTNPIATTFVAVARGDSKILSSATLAGPLPIPDDPDLAAKVSSLSPGILHWQLVAVYTRPEVRRTGLARAILQSTWEWVAQRSVLQGSSCMVTLDMVQDNHGARALYEGLGFSVVGGSEGNVRMVRCINSEPA